MYLKLNEYLCTKYGHLIIRDWCGPTFVCNEICPRCKYQGSIRWRKPKTGWFWRLFEGG